MRLGGTSPIWLLLAVALIFGVPQGLNSLALQNSVYYQADPERIGTSSGLLRTFVYLGSMVASAASATAFGQHADTGGMHQLAWFMLGSRRALPAPDGVRPGPAPRSRPALPRLTREVGYRAFE